MPRAKKTAAQATEATEQLPVLSPTETKGAAKTAAVSVETEAPTALEVKTLPALVPDVVEETAALLQSDTKRQAAITLKCSVNRDALHAALVLVRGSLPVRKSLPNPAIGLYRLTANRAAKTLAITTYNEVVGTTVTIPANVVSEGELLASKDLGDLVAMLPDAGITLSAETPNRLQVVMDSRTFSPKSMSAAGYPELLSLVGRGDAPNGNDETDGFTRYKVATEPFRRALEFVCPGASDAETSIFNSIRLDLWHGKKGDVFAVAASDESCLMVDESTVDDATLDLKAPSLTVCVPVKSFQILIRLLEEVEEEALNICFQAASGGTHVTLCLFQCGSKQLLTHLVTSEWANYRQHVPTQGIFTAQVVADRELLLSLVNCNLVFAIAKTFRTMLLDVSTQAGVLSTWVKTQTKGESVQQMVASISALNGGDLSVLKTLGLNAAKVKLALDLFSDTEIRWQFIQAQAPTLMSGGTKGRWIVLMPISVNDDSETDELPETVEPTTKKSGKKPQA